MTNPPTHPTPTGITLHRQRRLLEVEFDDGARFELPCEYLRVYSPAAEVKSARERGQAVTGKEGVNISSITPVGSYALRLAFDDGHDDGIYSWGTLYRLGAERERLWQEHLERAGAAGAGKSGQVDRDIRVLYFATLAERLGRDEEDLRLPAEVATPASLLALLRERGEQWERLLGDEQVRVMVNKQIVAPEDRSRTRIANGDQVGLVPDRIV
jgi:DUF971 family protein/molybdopterin converting factor small subunit